jgi:23S rRNA (guanosine2251-2'-O)-methyltransferase
MLTDAPDAVNPSARRAIGNGYVAAGTHAALAFLRARPGAVRRVLLGREASPAVEEAVRATGVRPEQTEGAELDRIAGGIPHQGLVAMGEAPPGLPASGLSADDVPLVLVLDGLTDPRNVGAVIRTAAAAGVGAVVMPRDRAPGLSPALVKAAAGAVEWVPIVRVVNLARSLNDLAAAGYWLVGLDGDSDTSLYDPKALPGLPCALVAGAEGAGLRQLTRRVCHRLVRIPMAGAVESLNVSVAVAVALFELRRATAGRAAG